ncbi:hypothetical protein C8R46DRAFT_1360365 [Mycena filopes]|nr:hypothetical protein C8R46DRAFT_1360365 [Mycena filopes]
MAAPNVATLRCLQKGQFCTLDDLRHSHMHPYVVPKIAEVIDTNVRFIRKSEIFWVEHQPWLEQQGYRLRPRYHPDWVPSWIQDPSKVIYKCEDGLTLPTGATIVDAIHISDGAHVMLKAVPQDRCPEEIHIGRFFVSDSDPANHCNAFRTTLQVPDNPNIQILVMPLLRSVLYPRFETIGELGASLAETIVYLNHVLPRRRKRVAERSFVDPTGFDLVKQQPYQIIPDIMISGI